MRANRQQGFALITILLIMALVVMLVAGMLRSHQLLIASVSHQTEASRGLQLLMSAEQRALRSLRERLPQDMRVIHRGQPWAQAQVFTLDEVHMRMRVEDLAARFNLGALTRNRKPDPVLLERWQRLCRALGVEPPGLEALYGQPLFDVSQLRDLPGVDAQVLERLRPWVTVLPAQAGLNVNTADGRVLAALEGVTPAVAQRLAEARPEDGHVSVQAFLADPLLDGRVTTGRGLGVSSRWFGMTLQAELGAWHMYLYSEVEMDVATQRLPGASARVFQSTTGRCRMSEYAIYLLPEGVGAVQASWPVLIRQPDGSTYRGRLDALTALAGQRVTLLLPMELFGYCQTGPLPGRRPGRDTLAFAVEERLATPLEELHLAFGAADDTTSRPCLAIDQACLAQLLSWLSAQAIEPLAVLVDADLLTSAGPTALWLEGRWLLGGKHQQRLATSPAGAAVLAASLPGMTWLAEPGQAFPGLAVQPVAQAFAMLWEGRAQAIDLRQGAFAPVRKGCVPWQGLLAGCLLAGLLLCLADYWRVGWLQRQAMQLQQDNLQTFQRWAPGHPPRADLARQVSELAQRPMPATAMQRLASLSEPLVESGGLWIERAERIANQGWRVEVIAQGFDDLERLRERLPGLQVGQAQQDAQRVRATLVWEAGQ